MADQKLRFIIDADGRKARAEIQGVDKAIQNLSRRGSSSGFADVLGGNLASNALSKLTSSLVAGGSAVIDYSAKLEQTKISFETLMGGAAAATKHLEELKKLSTSTPLEFQSITKMSQRLQGAGIEAGKVTELIKDIGNTAAATGDMTAERMEGIGVAISQVFAKGKVSAEEMEQLAERGIPAWRILSQQLNMTIGDTRKLAEEGKITSQQFLDAFQKFTQMNFGDAMEKQAATFTGAIGKITNLINVAAAEAFKPIFAKISTFAADVGSSLDEQQTKVQSHAVSFGQAIGEGIGAGMRRGFDASGTGSFLSALGFGGFGSFGWQMGGGIKKGLSGFDNTANMGGVQMKFDPATGTMVPVASSGGIKLGGTTPPGGTTLGKQTKPPKENDAEFRRFFNERGFEVTRTRGGAINSGSLHPSGMAADVRSRGKKIEDIFALTAAALEKGYRLFDERIKRPGVKQTGPHLHFERNGGTKASSFLGAEFYGGEQQLAYLKKLDAERLGKATGQTGFNEYREDLVKQKQQELDMAQGVLDDWLDAERAAVQDRLRLYRNESELAIQIIGQRVDQGIMTEKAAVEELGAMKLNILMEERAMLADSISTAENRIRIEELDLEIARQRIITERELAAIEKKRQDERNKSWATHIQNLEKQNQLETEAANREAQRAAEAAMVTAGGTLGGGIASGMGVSLVSVFDPENVGMMKTSAQYIKDIYADMADFAGNAIGSMVEGLASMAAAWLVTGEFSAKAALQMAAGAALGIATQAGFKAIFEYAEAAAAAARYDFYAAGMHTAAAKLYLKTAVIAGAVGVGLGLAGRAAGGGGGGSDSGSGSSSSFSSSQNQNPTAISRVSEDAFISGRGTPWQQAVEVFERLERKISSMKPGDVLTAGIQQRPRTIGRAVVEDIKRDASIGAAMQKRSGAR